MVRSRSVNPALVIGGPTASGKSELAIRLATELGSEIVNVDSVQIFREADIGSAKISPAQREEVPHHLIDCREPDDAISVGAYVRAVQEASAEIQNRGLSAVLVGGTTMYLTALFEGLSTLPAGNPEIRSQLEELTGDELLMKLTEHDPDTARRLHVNDRVRLIRALEVQLLTGTPLSEYHAQSEASHPACRGLFIILCWERDTLYARINERADRMLREGLFEEVRELVDKYGNEIQVLKTLGYAQVMEFLRGELAEKDVADRIAQFTRRFAKRQMTYWRNEPSKRGWDTFPKAAEQALELDYVEPDPSLRKGVRSNRKGVRVYDFQFDQLFDRVRERLSSPFDVNEVWYVSANTVFSSREPA